MQSRQFLLLVVALTTILGAHPTLRPQTRPLSEPAVQLCTQYSGSGDLVQASVTSHSFSISIVRLNGQRVDLARELEGSVPISNPVGDVPVPVPPSSFPVPCQVAVSQSSKTGALAIPIEGGILVELLDLEVRKITHTVHVLAAFPIRSNVQPIGFINDSETLGVSQMHYRPTGEPEIATQLVSEDGSLTSIAHTVTGHAVGRGFAFHIRFPRCPRLVSLSSLFREN